MVEPNFFPEKNTHFHVFKMILEIIFYIQKLDKYKKKLRKLPIHKKNYQPNQYLNPQEKKKQNDTEQSLILHENRASKQASFSRQPAFGKNLALSRRSVYLLWLLDPGDFFTIMPRFLARGRSRSINRLLYRPVSTIGFVDRGRMSLNRWIVDSIVVCIGI